MIEYECEDCSSNVTWIVKDVMPPEGQRVCAVCGFIRSQPEEDREPLRKALHVERALETHAMQLEEKIKACRNRIDDDTQTIERQLAEIVRLHKACGTPYSDICAERQRQDALWGGPQHDDTHDWHEWLDYINHQLQCFRHLQYVKHRAERRERFVKIAALAVAAIESIDRKTPPSIVCPRCGFRSFHPKDIEERYCGYCHDWHENMVEAKGVR